MKQKKTICKIALAYWEAEMEGTMTFSDVYNLCIESALFIRKLGIEGTMYDIFKGNELFYLSDGRRASNELYYTINPRQRVILFLKDAIKHGH